MEDKLKKYINDNKEGFDSLEVSPELWSKIESKMPNKKWSFSISLLLKVAATIIMILGASWLGYVVGEADRSNSIANTHDIQEQQNLAFEGMSEELMEVERYYVNEVKYRENQLIISKVDEELLVEVELLKEEFESLKLEMEKSINPIKVVEAMIENYQQRIDLLQSILNQLNKEEEELKEYRNESIA